MIFEVDGRDMLPYIAKKGIKWTRNDLDGPSAGRTMDGTMHRDRVSSKTRLDVTCLPLTSSDAAIVLNAIYPEYVTVRYTDPMQGLVVKTMYSNNIPATYINTETDLWEGIAFPLIER
jgi:hypothetical protein